MDISKITNLADLKAIAYDIMRERERLRENLELVMMRIGQLEQQAKVKPADSPQRRKQGLDL